jgi:hypothetical protein
MVIDLDTISRWLADPCTRPGAGKPECARHYHERAPRGAPALGRSNGCRRRTKDACGAARTAARSLSTGRYATQGPRTLAIDAATARRAAAESRYKKSNNYCM